ncbi:mCG1037508, partial [Mus musculus]
KSLVCLNLYLYNSFLLLVLLIFILRFFLPFYTKRITCWLFKLANMYLSLQDFWQIKLLHNKKTQKLCIFCGFWGKNCTFDFLSAGQC